MQSPTGLIIGVGYSGAPGFKNDPSKQMLRMEGCICEGFYTIEPPVNSPEHGPLAYPLTPDISNRMYGRSGFMLHGDSINHPGCASEGCIIQNHETRQIVAGALHVTNRLQVIP